VYSGDSLDTASTSAALAITVNKAASSVTLTSSLNPALAGQSVTFTAALTPAGATGTVQFLDGATVLGTSTVSSGMASFSIASLIVGSHSITALYSGDGNVAPSTSGALAETVNKVPSSVALISSLNPVVVGQSVTFTATISPNRATGTVQFFDGATPLATVTL